MQAVFQNSFENVFYVLRNSCNKLYKIEMNLISFQTRSIVISWRYCTPVLRVALWENALFSPAVRSKFARSPSLSRRQGVRVCFSSLCYLNKQFFLLRNYFSSSVMVSTPEYLSFGSIFKVLFREARWFSFRNERTMRLRVSIWNVDWTFCHYQCWNIYLLLSTFHLA